MQVQDLKIDSEELVGQRLDKALAILLPEFSRSRLQHLIEEKCVQVNGTWITESKYKVQHQDTIKIHIPDSRDADPIATPMDLEIVYEDKDLIVINKPAGLVVHPGAGNYEGTLVNGLLAYCPEDLSGIGGVKRPGIVHRLDKETSGLMVVAKNDIAHQHLSHQFEERSLSRLYLAFVVGHLMPSKGEISGNIGRSRFNRQKMALLKTGGREAITQYQNQDVYYYQDKIVASLIQCKLLTGRTHQIRVHLTHKGHPLIGDPIYGTTPLKLQRLLQANQVNLDRQALHAGELSFIHPTTEKKMTFKAPLPQDLGLLKETLENLD